MNIIMISVPNSYPIIATYLSDDAHTLTVEYPVAIYKDSPHVYTTQYMPFAESGIVVFKKQNIICISKVQEKVEKFYLKSIEYYKEIKTQDYEMQNGKDENDIEEEDNFLTKTFH